MSKAAKQRPAGPTRKERKVALRNARHLSREVPWLLHKHKTRVPIAAQWELCDATRELRRLLAAPRRERDFAALQRQSEALDRAAERSLGSVRASKKTQYTLSLGGALLVALFIRMFLFEAFKIPTGSMIPTLLVGDHLFVTKSVYGIRVPFTNYRFFSFRNPAKGEVCVFEHPHPTKGDGDVLIKRVMAEAGDRVRLEENVWYVNGEPLGPPKVLARSLSCKVQAGETCHWFLSNPLDYMSAVGATPPRTGGDGCPCTYLEETSGGRTWISQHVTPGVTCQCSDPNDADKPETQRRWHVVFNTPDWPVPGLAPINFPDRWPQDQLAQVTQAKAPNGRLELVIPEGFVLMMGDNRDNSDDGRYWGLVPLGNIKGKALFIWAAGEDFMGRFLHFVH